MRCVNDMLCLEASQGLNQREIRSSGPRVYPGNLDLGISEATLENWIWAATQPDDCSARQEEPTFRHYHSTLFFDNLSNLLLPRSFVARLFSLSLHSLCCFEAPSCVKHMWFPAKNAIGYGSKFPANQPDGSQMLLAVRGYGFGRGRLYL